MLNGRVRNEKEEGEETNKSFDYDNLVMNSISYHHIISSYHVI